MSDQRECWHLTKPENKNEYDRRKASFDVLPHVSEDGKQCTAEVTSPDTPTTGATKLTVSGIIVLRTATKKKSFAAEKVLLKPDTPIRAGAIPLTIKSTGGMEWVGNEKFCVVLEAKQNMDSVANIEFFDAAGKNIDAERASWGRGGVGNGMAETWTYQFERKVDSAKIVVSYWTDMKKIAVPFTVTASVGL